MNRFSYVVRWTDRDGKRHRKEYADDAGARKAKAWLLENGALEIDLAAQINGLTTAVNEEVKRKEKVPEELPEPWYNR